MQEIGWEEWVALPELGLPAIKAKVDTGAKTSALHAFMVEKIIEKDEVKIRFGIHPVPERPEIEVFCIGHLVAEREVTSSSGQTELRYVIRTLGKFGKSQWPIEISLTNRETMAYRMLIGRSAMEGHLIVVPGKSFLLGTPSASVYKRFVPPKHKQRSLHIGILSHLRESYAIDRLTNAAQRQGHTVKVIHASKCYFEVSAHPLSIHYQHKALGWFDAIIADSLDFYGLAIQRQFESLGSFCMNDTQSIIHARDKLFSYQLLGRAGITMPLTAFAHCPHDNKALIKLVGGAPLVIKVLDGPKGKGTVFAETTKAALTVIQAFKGLKANFIVQEYIKEPDCKDIRCLVIGSKVVAAVEKFMIFEKQEPQEQITEIRLDIAEKKLAVKAIRILGLKFGIVDLLRTKEGPKVMDVHEGLKFKKIEKVMEIDVASHLIDYIETQARPRLAKRIVGHPQ